VTTQDLLLDALAEFGEAAIGLIVRRGDRVYDLLARNGRWTAIIEIDTDYEDEGGEMVEGFGDTANAAIESCLREAQQQEQAIAAEREDDDAA